MIRGAGPRGHDSHTAAALLARANAPGFVPIGTSVGGRSIASASFGALAASSMLIVGGVHGDEPSSVAAVLALSAYLAHQPPKRALTVVPALNPDGLHAVHKDNARGVDLNRNFPARNFSTEHAPGYFPGSHAASEPETAALVALIENARPTAVVAVHAPLACVNYDGPADAWADAVARACGWPAQADIGYPTPGSLGSWLGVDRGLPVLTLELPPGPLADFAARAQAALVAAIDAAP